MSYDKESMTLQVRTLSAVGSRTALAAAEKLATEKRLKISIAVVDIAGNLMAFQRMDSASAASVAGAIGKARTAANIGAPTKVLHDRLLAGATVLLSFPDTIPAQGGVPLIVDGAVVGAIGASGASGADDEMVAMAGASALAGI